MIRELGYLLVGAPDVEEWRAFSGETLGAMTLDGPNGALYVKVDPRAFRIAVLPGRDNGLIASGWLVGGPDEVEKFRADLATDGVPIEEGDEAGARLRQVQAYFGFTDPAGHAHEIGWGPISDYLPFVSSRAVSRFVTEGMGLGHIVLAAPDAFDEEVAFWTRPGRFALSDVLRVPRADGPAPARVHFLHCANPRQHSLALGELRVPGGCIHMMLEVGTIDDVGRCLDRVHAAKVPLVATLGRHVNDEMVSFYVATPGAFALEYGVGGKQVDWSEHIPFETTRGSDWGHVWAAPGA